MCCVKSGTLACASDAVDDIWVPIPDLDRYGLSELNSVSRAVASRVGPGERIGPRPLLG